MEITYHPAKRDATLTERGLDFEDAAKVFAGRKATIRDDRRDYGEDRFQTLWDSRWPRRHGRLDAAPSGSARHLNEVLP